MEIQRYSQRIVFKDEGEKGFTIEFPDKDCVMGATFIKFKYFDDYSKFLNIDFWLYFLYYEKYSHSYMFHKR